MGDSDIGYCGIYRSSILAYLREEDEDTKVSYILQLGDLGQQGALYLGFTEELAAELTGGTLRIKTAAARAMGMLGSEGERHADAIADLLDSEGTSDHAQSVAAQALGLLGPSGAQHAGRIAALLESKNTEVLIDACNSLGSLGMAVAGQAGGVKALFKHEDVCVRCAALCAAGKTGICAKDISSHLASENGRTRCAAAVALGAIGKKAAGQYVPAIIKLLGDNYEDIETANLAISAVVPRPDKSLRLTQCAAAEALKTLGSGAAGSLPKLADLLKHEHNDVRLSAVEALGVLGKDWSSAGEYEADLMTAFEDKNVVVRAAAVLAVGKVAELRGTTQRQSVEGVTKMLQSQHPSVRKSAAQALGMMGVAASGSAGDLLKCFKDRSAAVQASAMKALAQVGPKGQIFAGEVAKKLYDPDDTVREGAFKALPLFGERGAAYAEELADQLEDPEADIRGSALEALFKIGEGAAPVRNLIAQCRNDRVARVRELADEVLSKIN